MELRALKSFVRVADLGSITRAAIELAIVQPALSRQIQRIEEELGAALLTRLPRGVQLTSAGRQFLEHARRILELLGKEVDRGVITSAETVGAIQAIEAAIAESRAHPVTEEVARDVSAHHNADGDDHEHEKPEPVSFSARRTILHPIRWAMPRPAKRSEWIWSYRYPYPKCTASRSGNSGCWCQYF